MSGPEEYGPITAQPGPQEEFLRTPADIAIMGGAAGGGKALALDTKIPTAVGWTDFASIKVGDVVFAPDGKLCSVVYVSPVMYDHECFEVEFDTGERIIADAEHLWPTRTEHEREQELRRTPEFRANRRARRGRRGTGARPWMVDRNQAMALDRASALLTPPATVFRATREILQTLYVRGGRVNHSIDMPAPIDGPHVNFDIHPYVLGVWLGDGSTVSGQVTVYENSIIDNMLACGETGHFQGSAPHQFVIDGLTKRLRRGGVLGNKHIPMSYLRASMQQRLDLLCGLMDTDGTVDKNGKCEFSVNRKELAGGVLELLRTLGIKCTMRAGDSKLYGRITGTRYRLVFTPPCYVFKLPRKAERQDFLELRKTTRRRYIVNVRTVPSAPVRCIQVDHPSHCYLVGDGFIASHNTYALLLDPLRWVKNPGFGAIIFRRTFPQITMTGGLWDASLNVYSHVGGKPLVGLVKWKFGTGSSISFAHLQHEAAVNDYLGLQAAFIGFDQLEQFNKDSFIFLLSRNRSTCGVKPYMRATCNPDADSWLASFLAWWIDQETGYPIPQRSGKIRWFVNDSGEIIWGSRDKLHQRFPAIEPKSVTFIPALVQQNKILMREDPGYLANLMSLPPVEQERMLRGNWKVKAEAGKIFNRAWFEIVPEAPHGGMEVRFWDLAATGKETKSGAATAGVRMRLVKDTYYIMDVIEEFWGPAEVEDKLVAVARADALSAKMSNTRYQVRWELEGGSAGLRNEVELIKKLHGIHAHGARPHGGKFERARPLATMAMVGKVKLVRGAWNEQFLQHMHNQPTTPRRDIMDAASGAYDDLRLAGWAVGSG